MYNKCNNFKINIVHYNETGENNYMLSHIKIDDYN